MRRLFSATVLLCLTTTFVFTQESDKNRRSDPNPVSNGIGIFIGSLRVPYSGVVTGIDFQSPLLDAVPISFDSRLESRGTFFLLNVQSFDVEAAALFAVPGEIFTLSCGPGYAIFVRNNNDERSTATTTNAPFLRIKGDLKLLRADVDLDVKAAMDTTFFADGLGLSLRPEFVFGTGNFFAALDLRAQLLARIWGSGRVPQDSAFYMDSFVTLGLRF